MKRLLLLALPWMAMATVANGQVRQAHVTYSYFGPLKSPAYRVADECFFPVSSLKDIGWNAEIVDGQAQVNAEGSHITLPLRNVVGRDCVPLCLAISKLGGEATWSDADPGALDIVALVDSISLQDGHLKFDASMNIKAIVSTDRDPARVVVDLPGTRLRKSGKYELDSRSRLGQYKPDVVRVVCETSEAPESLAPVGPGRSVNVHLFSARKVEPVAPTPAVVKPPAPKQDPPVTEEKGPDSVPDTDDASSAIPTSGGGTRVKLPIPVGPAPGTQTRMQDPTADAVALKPGVPVGPPKLVAESQDSLTIGMALPSPLSSAPQVTRPQPRVIEVLLPKADLKLSPDFKLDTESVTSVTTRKEGADSVLTLNCVRAMGAEVVANGAQVEIRLMKPKVGNGKLAGKTIVVDPGHGGRDTGCFSPDHTVLEKDLTLSMGKLVAQRLAEDGAIVLLTRKTDYLTPLEERPKIANRNSADFFISIHVNSLSIDNKISGTRTYYHGSNKISQLLGECLQSEIVKVSGLPSKGVASDTSLYTTGLSVLRGTDKNIPAVLIEVGFINHDVDRAAMIQPEFQLAFALAVERGLKDYLGDAKTD